MIVPGLFPETHYPRFLQKVSPNSRHCFCDVTVVTGLLVLSINMQFAHLVDVIVGPEGFWFHLASAYQTNELLSLLQRVSRMEDVSPPNSFNAI